MLEFGTGEGKWKERDLVDLGRTGFKLPLSLVSPGSLRPAASALKAAQVGAGEARTMPASQNPVGKMEHIEGGRLHSVGSARGRAHSPLLVVTPH